MQYSASTLRSLIRDATTLGFNDDVAHWTAELAKLEAEADKETR